MVSTCVVTSLAAGGFAIAQTASSHPSISESRLNTTIAAMQQQIGKQISVEQREQLRQRILETEVLKEQALKLKLDKSPTY